MYSESKIQAIVKAVDIAEKVYALFHYLGYPKEKLLNPSYKRKIDDFDFNKEKKDKIKNIYTIFNFDRKLQIFLIKTKTISNSFIRYITQKFSDMYLRLLLIFTSDFQNYTFAFPEFERIEEGKYKLKITKLNFDRTNPYYTDLFTINNLSLTGQEQTWRDIWFKWKEAHKKLTIVC